jgi:hypothetical protein
VLSLLAQLGSEEAAISVSSDEGTRATATYNLSRRARLLRFRSSSWEVRSASGW